ncbi:trypsin-like peptidase domain-containing protein [Rubripirellula reticaptiva]|uniref:Thioredoxin n=1 Tax=Rubripirellula reticaptiva TaxID=2528013 RepID=A0A5C6F0F4_9BACT|nr:trypsin-like peptidase domain-containing protein [Rubripirellula reticaptiva]TWU55353.1 Thioredoxin [Rubripirellula reticaptiva]
MTRLMFAWAATVGLLAVTLMSSVATAADAILIEFSSSHCVPCQAMKPVLAQLERSGVPIRHVDVASEPAVASRYGIRKTPTFIVVSGGKEVTRLVGIQTFDQLQRAIATDPSGPLFATGAVKRSFDDIPAPQTRLAPVGSQLGSFQSRPAPTDPLFGQPTPPSNPNTLVAAAAPSNNIRSEAMPNMSAADAVQRAEAATVRLRVHDGKGYGAGTGTIIDTHGEDALVLTCGHLFRDNEGKGKIEVDIFVGGEVRTVLGEVIDFDADTRDIALVAIRPGFPVHPVSVVSLDELPRNGQTVFSFGCDRGDDPSRRDTRITGINKYNQHLGASNIEIDGAPIDGRSGGGLFDEQGRLVGVCNAADYKNDVGIYAGSGAVQWQLDRVNLSHLYQPNPAASVASAPQTQNQSPQNPPADRIASLPNGVQQDFGQVMQASAISSDQEVIVIVRDRNNPGAKSQVMTLREPTADLMQMIQRHAR